MYMGRWAYEKAWNIADRDRCTVVLPWKRSCNVYKIEHTVFFLCSDYYIQLPARQQTRPGNVCMSEEASAVDLFIRERHATKAQTQRGREPPPALLFLSEVVYIPIFCTLPAEGICICMHVCTSGRLRLTHYRFPSYRTVPYRIGLAWLGVRGAPPRSRTQDADTPPFSSACACDAYVHVPSVYPIYMCVYGYRMV